ncbi:MAG: hypothetical protein HYX78_04265 [Armatimonadetes bacterium]|nr:hypothetical protein [Armatimonadota bacterium]
MVETPKFVEGCDYSRFDLNNYYDTEHIDSLIANLRLERAEYIERFPGLEPAVARAVEF